MSRYSLCFGYLPHGEKFKHGVEGDGQGDADTFEVVDYERARHLGTDTLWFFDKFQPVTVDAERIPFIGKPTKMEPHLVCSLPCLACQSRDLHGQVAQEALRGTYLEVDETATLETLPDYCLEALALQELLGQLGFQAEELLFMPRDEGLYVAVAINDPRVVEQMQGDTVYPIKAVDLPSGVTSKSVIMRWATCAVLWHRASPEVRKGVLAKSKVKNRAADIKTDLANAGLLNVRQN